MASTDETNVDRLEPPRDEVTVRDAESRDLQARIDAAIALHPRVLTDKGYLPEPVWFCTADHQRWPCANVRALTGEGT